MEIKNFKHPFFFFFLFSFGLANLLEFYYTFSENLVIKNPKPKFYFIFSIYIFKNWPPKKPKKKKHTWGTTIQGN